jgi:hypothetical protein
MMIRTDADALHTDVIILVAAGWFTEALIPAALQAETAGVAPPSLRILTELVRRGGAGYTATLPHLLPTAEQSALVRAWLTANPDDERLARWLDAIATVLETREISQR